MEDIRAQYGFGRGLAAPKPGNMKRLFYLNLDKPYITIINLNSMAPFFTGNQGYLNLFPYFCTNLTGSN